MPITRKQFELEIDTKTEEWMDKIKVFLAEHKDGAFTEYELRQHYSPILLGLLSEQEKRLFHITKKDLFDFLPDEAQAFHLALEKLVQTIDVEKRIIRDTEYYAYREEIRF